MFFLPFTYLHCWSKQILKCWYLDTLPHPFLATYAQGPTWMSIIATSNVPTDQHFIFIILYLCSVLTALLKPHEAIYWRATSIFNRENTIPKFHQFKSILVTLNLNQLFSFKLCFTGMVTDFDVSNQSKLYFNAIRFIIVLFSMFLLNFQANSLPTLFSYSFSKYIRVSVPINNTVYGSVFVRYSLWTLTFN